MNNYFGKLCMAAATIACTTLQALPEPYASINILPQRPSFVQDGYIIYSLASASNVEVIIDVESSEGGVARYLAMQANNLPSLRQIYSVNLWQSNDRSQKQLYRRFLSNVIQENTSELITPIRMSSEEGAKSLHILADLIHLVGGNDQQTIYNDILSWYPRLSERGIMCGNNWDEPSIQSGVTQAARTLDATLQISGTVWYFVKGS